MQIASIDIGTNTILLLIAKIKNSELEVTKEEIRIPRIGKDVAKLKFITDESARKLIAVLSEYKNICRSFGVEKIICYGTAPFRIARNSNQVIDAVYEETGIQIKILSSKDEALVTFIGGISNFNEFFEKYNFVVFDIGGGSTELTYGNINKILFSKSYDIGAVTLKESFFNSFPYSITLNRVYEHLSKIFVDKFFFRNFITIAVDGTPTTIASIKLNQKIFDEREVDKIQISKDFLESLVDEFYFISPTNILKKFPSVIKGREDVILTGSIILNYLLESLQVKNFFVSVRGIRYGIIIREMMNQTRGFWTKVGLKKFLSSLKG